MAEPPDQQADDDVLACPATNSDPARFKAPLLLLRLMFALGLGAPLLLTLLPEAELEGIAD